MLAICVARCQMANGIIVNQATDISRPSMFLQNGSIDSLGYRSFFRSALTIVTAIAIAISTTASLLQVGKEGEQRPGQFHEVLGLLNLPCLCPGSDDQQASVRLPPSSRIACCSTVTGDGVNLRGTI